SITFKPDDEEEALIPLIFNLKASDFANVATATTSYSPNDVKKVATLNNGAADLEVEDIHGFVYESDRGIDKPVDSSQGTREIKGKTKFANAVVNIHSSLGEGNEFPDLQVNEKGEFSFNASEVGIRLNNGEKLHFTVVDPLTGAILSNLVTKEITVAETEEEKKERTLNELLDITPAYYRLVGDEIRGYDIHGNVLDYFNANDKEEIARHFKSLGIDQPNFKLLPGWPTETKSATMTDSKPALSVAANTTAMPKVSVQAPSEVKSVTSPEASLETRSETTPKTKTEPTTIAKSASRPNTASQLSTTAETTPASQTIPVTTLGVASMNQTMMQSSSAPTPVSTNVVSHAKTTQAKALPETGYEKTHAGLLGTFLLGLGALFLLGRKRKSN
ncbi:LPXTG cell wall anchor domain-containing protein, partial [Staphylococcus hyicus]